MSMHKGKTIGYFSPQVYRPLRYTPHTKSGAALVFRLGIVVDDKPYINCFTCLPKPDWLRLFR